MLRLLFPVDGILKGKIKRNKKKKKGVSLARNRTPATRNSVVDKPPLLDTTTDNRFSRNSEWGICGTDASPHLLLH